MKIRISVLLTILGIFFTSPTLAQCPTGDVTLTSQEAVNNFGTDYGSCTSLYGKLTIGPSTDIIDLSPLSNITNISGEFEIIGNDVLTTLDGLHNITAIKSIAIRNNPQLTSLDVFESASVVDGYLSISNCDALTSLSEMKGVTKVNGVLQILDNDILASLLDLEKVVMVKQLSIIGNMTLSTLQGLQNIDPESISILSIYENPNLYICDLPNICTYISSNKALRIYGNAPGCETATDIKKACFPCPVNVTLKTQDEVNSFGQTYGHCTVVGGDLIISGADITNLQPLDHITSVKGELQIINADQLTTLAGLGNITSIGGVLEIEENDGLTNLSGLDNLTSVGGAIYIQENKKLINLSGLEQLTSVRESLHIWFNPKLNTLSALRDLTSVGSSLQIVDCDMLTNLSGLEGITSIGSTLYIGGNAVITDLSALHNLTSIGTSLLSIKNNALLTTLQGLHNIDPESIDYIRFTNNPQLSICDMPNICTVLESDARIVIEENALGCNTAMEVETACLPEVKSITSPADITAACGSSARDLDLPSTVQVTYDDLSMGQLAVIWDLTDYTGFKGSDTLTGTLDLMDQATNPGNLTTEVIIIVEAPERPVMQCAENYILSCDPVVHFDRPVATDQCGVVRVEQTDRTGLSSGSVFPVGITTLTYRANNAAGSSYCTIEIEILPDLNVQHVSGVAESDTLHLAACLPPRISEDDLDIGAHQRHSNVSTRIFSQDAPSDSEDGMWKLLNYEYTVTSYCGGTGTFRNYVALYDLSPPMFLNFPEDTTIPSTDDLPPVSEEVNIIDLCRFVVWDTVITTPIAEIESDDTLAFVRRWMAEDEVGNRSFRDQMIYMAPTSVEQFGSVKAHVARESDLINTHFPGSAGTDGIPVTLYRIDSSAQNTVAVDSLDSGNWQGQHGNVLFTPLRTGMYRLKIEVPRGYLALNPDALFSEDGWSDTLAVQGNSPLDLGTILFIPVPDTTVTDTLPPVALIDYTQITQTRIASESFTLYPNPTSGKVSIRIPQSETFDYRIYNHLGQLVENGSASDGAEIDLSNRVAGMYFIHVRSGKVDLGSKKVVVGN